ncbi:hypothetical protein V1477_006373 [Vespula maculifrons]|uniref:Uncharacterized protein n=1 Tax=Vespula maculifrons TaxID=7453 RepID=A0ABD2CMV2_VESMC
MRAEDATSSFKRPRSGSPRYYSFGEKNYITRLLLARSVRKKYGRRGRDEPFPMTPLSCYWSDLDEKNMGVEGPTSPFQ